ncbi:hypothetical protein ElyMa_006600900 [Elysia marginata]|uniref:Uncharacterized protein n=1 Tax=Elysia marginata TaxID=1093978 RepID=A0AAV4IGX6_9GAST|nr:hypothetical protein ElyMa_006600900 [Elysia marginata]
MSAGHVLRAACLTVWVLFWLQSDARVGGFPSGATALDKQHRSRLSQLLADVVDSSRMRLATLLVPEPETGEDKSALQKFKEAYRNYHPQLTRFLENLKNHLIPGSPQAFQHMTIIPEIMPLDHADFVHLNERGRQTARTIYVITGKLIDKALAFVKDSHKASIENAANWVRISGSTVEDAIQELGTLTDVTQPDEDASAGMGDINGGDDGRSRVDPDKLRELLLALE